MHHGGAVLGTVTWVSMIPELNLGVVVFTNQQNSAAMEAVGGQILDAYLGAKHRDWVGIAQNIMAERDTTAAKVEDAAAGIAAKAGPPSLPLATYAGTYRDSWRGAATVELTGNQLKIRISRTKSLEGPLIPYNGNIFIVRWNDRTLNADAFVRFEQGFDQKITNMTMRSISPSTDFSFDFQDLDFKKSD